jgi:Zn-dependent protease
LRQFDLRETILMLPAILFGFAIHEFWHAYTATRFGDNTPAKQGRLTLNPLSHIDPIGILMFVIAGFGWAKPVQVNPQAFRNTKRDDLIVSLAGPLSNFIAAFIFALIIKGLFTFAGHLFTIAEYGDYIFRMLEYFVWVNLVMFVFNLIPFPPLDGSHILFSFLPERFDHFKEQFYRMGGTLLMFLVLFSSMSDYDLLPIGKITRTLFDTLFELLKI